MVSSVTFEYPDVEYGARDPTAVNTCICGLCADQGDQCKEHQPHSLLQR